MSNTVEVKTKKLKSPLINKKVKIALIEQSPNSLHKNSNQATLLTGASKDFACPINEFGTLIDPLENWEREYLENLLGLDLNIHVKNTPENPKANFWTTKSAKLILKKPTFNLESATRTLDLSKPFEFILYKIALINPRVANSWAERHEQGKLCEFVIKDGEVELEEELSYLEKDDAVLAYLLKNKKSKKKLFDLLRLYGSNKNSGLLTFDTSIDKLYNELRKIARTKSEVLKLYDLVSLGEKDVSTKVFLADAVTVGLIEKRGTEYRLMGGDKIGSNELEAIAYLEDTKNQSIKIKIQGAIDKFYKNK